MSEDPGRTSGPGYESLPPRAGQVLAGVLLLLCGLCLFLVGGGCTILWVTILLEGSWGGGGDGIGLLLLSLAVLGIGLLAIVKGVQMLRRRRPEGSEAAGTGTDGSTGA